MNLKVGLTYNLKRQARAEDGVPADFYAEFDEEETIDAIANALTKGGCTVTKIEADEKAYGLLRRLNPHIVFNVAEGLRGESRESHMPTILEMLGIPYTGSGPLTLAIALNKGVTHRLLNAIGVPCPAFQVFPKADVKIDPHLKYPFVVKPLTEGSSKGVRNNSLVNDEQSLRRQVAWVIKTYKQAAIVEEFLPGREFTVSLLGNDEPTALPIVEIVFDQLPIGSNPLYSYEAKWVWDVPEKPVDMFRCPAAIPKTLEKELKHVAVAAFKALNCRDVCRIDIRLDEKNNPRILDVNPLPGLIPNPDAHSCLPEAARAAGYTYNQLICTILGQALKRHKLQHQFDNFSLIKRP
jgi:D-alanine-D-alanine ligase